MAVTVTSIVIITERDEGVWDRTLVSGVTTTEILISHLLTQGLVMILQTLEVMLTSFGLFGLQCNGSFLTVLLLLLIQGLCGMCTGTTKLSTFIIIIIILVHRSNGNDYHFRFFHFRLLRHRHVVKLRINGKFRTHNRFKR